MTTPNDQETPLVTHLRELRHCLVKSIMAIALTMTICAFYSREIFQLLAQPLKNALPATSFLIATHPVEAWLTYFKTTVLAGFFAASPVLFYQFWKFIAPGLYKNEQRLSLVFVIFSTLLFVGGSLFGYFVIFPLGFDYFVSVVAGTDIHFLPRMEDYLSFASMMLLAFGLSFELPLLVYFLALADLVTLSTLVAIRKYVIVLALIVAAVLTPPDVVSQVLLGIPLIALYEVGLLAVFVREKLSKKTNS